MLILGKELIGNPIVSLENGRILGHVKDVYVDKPLQMIEGLYLGSDGIFSREAHFISRDEIDKIGEDTVLVSSSDCVQKGEESPLWLRREDLKGREVDTPGGTRIGDVDDIIIDESGTVVGVALGRVYVKGPVARNRAIKRTAVLDTGEGDGAMTIELAQAENQEMGVIESSLFSSREVTAPTGEDKSPYTTPAPEDSGVEHDAPEEPYKSPYVSGEPEERSASDDGFKSPHATPDRTESREHDEYKSPYATPESSTE
ncbi:MAG: PRC-barrel domain-containing protein [Ardenticatenaceae bacterium]|nr:PRC-barrel domain-containing protein [Anaerolineales bacterium]MCB8985742.1 PRC-barrel domain-containing protein [Ardenticatenaceae bacterium]